MQQEESPLAEILVTSKVVGELKVAKQDGQVPQDDMVKFLIMLVNDLRRACKCDLPSW